MLSRVASQLYWLGRYLERTEHLARYLSVEYFSSLDSPHELEHEIALLSIMDMVGIPLEDEKKVPTEEFVLMSVALDEKNPVSILSSVSFCRENARGVRDTISTELWEAINTYYLYVVNYPAEIYKTKGLYDFTQNVIQSCSNVRGRIEYTLLHDVAWYFIQLGLFIERAAQTVRIMSSKLTDIEEFSKLKLGKTLESEQWSILLDCLEAKDMCRRFYNNGPNRHNTIEFLLLNPKFPRSVLINLNRLKKCVSWINQSKIADKHSLEFKVGKIINTYQYLEIEEIQEDPIAFLDKTLQNIHHIHEMIVDKYFKN